MKNFPVFAPIEGLYQLRNPTCIICTLFAPARKVLFTFWSNSLTLHEPNILLRVFTHAISGQNAKRTEKKSERRWNEEHEKGLSLAIGIHFRESWGIGVGIFCISLKICSLKWGRVPYFRLIIVDNPPTFLEAFSFTSNHDPINAIQRTSQFWFGSHTIFYLSSTVQFRVLLLPRSDTLLFSPPSRFNWEKRPVATRPFLALSISLDRSY